MASRKVPMRPDGSLKSLLVGAAILSISLLGCAVLGIGATQFLGVFLPLGASLPPRHLSLLCSRLQRGCLRAPKAPRD